MNGLVETVSKGSASFQRLNKHLLDPQATMAPRADKSPVIAQDSGRKRVRQNSAGLNKTEQAFLDHLNRGDWTVLSQSLTLKLGNGVRFTPDFITVTAARITRAYEVKGFMRDDAAVKLKVAASLYPWIKFHLVTKKKGGGWDIQEVLP